MFSPSYARSIKMSHTESLETQRHSDSALNKKLKEKRTKYKLRQCPDIYTHRKRQLSKTGIDYGIENVR